MDKIHAVVGQNIFVATSMFWAAQKIQRETCWRNQDALVWACSDNRPIERLRWKGKKKIQNRGAIQHKGGGAAWSSHPWKLLLSEALGKTDLIGFQQGLRRHLKGFKRASFDDISLLRRPLETNKQRTKCPFMFVSHTVNQLFFSPFWEKYT